MMMDAWWLASSVPAATVLASFEHASDSKLGKLPEAAGQQ
jgi:hypothetical protein